MTTEEGKQMENTASVLKDVQDLPTTKEEDEKAKGWDGQRCCDARLAVTPPSLSGRYPPSLRKHSEVEGSSCGPGLRCGRHSLMLWSAWLIQLDGVRSFPKTMRQREIFKQLPQAYLLLLLSWTCPCYFELAAIDKWTRFTLAGHEVWRGCGEGSQKPEMGITWGCCSSFCIPITGLIPLPWDRTCHPSLTVPGTGLLGISQAAIQRSAQMAPLGKAISKQDIQLCILPLSNRTTPEERPGARLS